ncbi:MAG: O-antigen ligase family protein, partial [Phycisphaeraceae bacterium]|nr:O-antigen ligase family protein [Phycisphaeraceae bacterium]
MTSAVPDKSVSPKTGKRDRHNAGHSSVIDAPLCAFDHIIEKMLMGLLIFMPLAMGVRSAWTEEVVIALSGLICIVFWLKLVVHCRQRFVLTWAYVPVLIFLLGATAQLIPWPTAWVSVVSPNTVTLKGELLEGIPIPDANAPASDTMTLSFYTHATQHDLRMVLAIAGVFVVVLNVFRRTDQIKRLLLSIALIGGGIAAIAMLQDVFGNGKIFWIIPTPTGTAYAGPFINHSHYGQFMNLSIGATLGYLCVILYEDFLRRRVTLSMLTQYITLPSTRRLWGLIGIMSLGAVTVFVSLTRGGMVSVIAATTFTTILLVRRQSLRGLGWIMVVMALVTFAGLLYAGFDAVVDRFGSLSELDNGGYDVRWQIIQDLTHCYRQFPLLGTGLGTHAVVYPMFQSVNSTALFTHAENEYAQLMEEMGLVGLVSMVWFGLIVWTNFARSLRDHRLPIRAAIYGLGFGLIAILVHSLSDYGQHMPANAFLSIFCALLLVLSRLGRARESVTLSRARWLGLLTIRGVALIATCGICTWAVIGAHHYRVAEASWANVLTQEKDLVDNQWQGTDDAYDRIISLASVSLASQPDNIEYRYWLNVYRWYRVTRNEDLVRGFLPDASIVVVHDLMDGLYQGCRDCSTFGPSYSALGQIKKLVFYEDEEGALLIRRGARLAPCNPMMCMVSGCLDIQEGEVDASLERFRKAVHLNGRFFRGLADIYINGVNRPDLAVALAEENVGWLSYVANALVKKEGYEEMVDQAQVRVMALLTDRCSRPDAPASAFISLANIYRKNKDYVMAIDLYYQALVLDY